MTIMLQVTLGQIGAAGSGEELLVSLRDIGLRFVPFRNNLGSVQAVLFRC
jgi:hypothetical protein